MLSSRQRAHAVRLAYSAAQLAAGKRSWRTPDVQELGGWLYRQIERHAAQDARLPRLLTPAQEWWLWRQCALEATRDLPLLNRGALAEGLQRATRLACEHHIDLRAPQPPGTEAALLQTVRRAVMARAQDLGALTLTQSLEQLPGILSPGPVAFCGFVQPTPRLAALAASRPLESGQSQLLLPEPPMATPRVVRAADMDSELEQIAQWCRLQAQRHARVRLLVMLPGSPGRRERLASLIRQTLDPGGWLQSESSRDLVGVEGGSPLARLSVVSHALTSLALLSGRPLELAALGTWLRAPHWSHATAARFPSLDLWLTEQGVLSFSLPELFSALKHAPTPLGGTARELVRRLRAAAAPLDAASAPPREWSKKMRECLRILGWPGPRTRDSGEEQTIARFEELLEEIGTLEAVARELSRDHAVQWLTEQAARTAFRPADADPIVTLSPHLVDPVVRMDAIWVAGLSADVFPQPVQADPYLPLSAQLAMQVPSAFPAGRLQEAQALLAAWRAASPDLTLSAPKYSQDLELLPSPLLAGWPQEPVVRTSGWLPLQLHREGQLEVLEDAVGMAWPAQQPLPSGTRALELQSQCPFRAYAELRLGARELRLPQPGVAPDVRGKLLHGALQRFWAQVGDWRGLCALSDEALQRVVEDCVAQSADALSIRTHERSFARERIRASRLIAALCRLERERLPFKVVATELESGVTLGGAPLRVRIDRVDELEGGARAVLDYKSGARVAADWYGAQPSHPQLLTYLAALGDNVVALATVHVNARELRFDGVAQRPDLLPKVRAVPAGTDLTHEAAWDRQRRAWLESLEHLAADFIEGQATVSPRPGACDTCHLQGLCRISADPLPEPEPPAGQDEAA